MIVSAVIRIGVTHTPTRTIHEDDRTESLYESLYWDLEALPFNASIMSGPENYEIGQYYYIAVGANPDGFEKAEREVREVFTQLGFVLEVE